MAKGAQPDEPSGGPPDDHVIVGRIRGPWGLQGDLNVEVMSDSSGRFAAGSVLYLGNAPARVERLRATASGLLVKLDVVGDRTTGELLRGRYLTVPKDQVLPLSKGAYYHFQIIDMAVYDQRGQHLGWVKEILPTGSNDVYVVRGEGRLELLVPALSGVVLEVDTQENRMTVRLPEGPQAAPSSGHPEGR